MGTPLQTFQPPLPEHLDFDRLRDRALARLQALAGGQWTDFNAHDPGVTLLEALCYALTELGYRAGYPVSDWLAEGDGGASLPGPETALSSPPVSAGDWRRLLSANAGSRYARLYAPEESKAPAVLYYYAEDEGGALSNTPDPGARAVPLRGLLRAALADEKTLHAFRGLGTDYAGSQGLSQMPLTIRLEVEVAPEFNHPETLRELGRQLVVALREVVEMPPRFQSPAEQLAAGIPPEDVYEGPLLSQGIPVKDERPDVSERHALYVSDLVGAASAVPGVRLLRLIKVSRVGADESKEWVLPVPRDVQPYIDHFDLHLFSGGVLVLKIVGPQAQEPALVPFALPSATPAPAGRRRHIGRYHSIRHQLPAVYGLDADDPESPARARQLGAYLLFFEQILANAFGTLGEAARLFSPASDGWGEPVFRLLNEVPGASGLWTSDAETLAEDWENPEHAPRRRLRLLDHWLARFGESLPRLPENPDIAPEKQLQELQTFTDTCRAFWKSWPELGARRGLGFDASRPEDTGGVEQRIAALLGLAVNEDFYLVEHILLRPLPEDVPDERGFLLTEVPGPDPYSLQVTFVYPKGEGRFAWPEFEPLFARTVREETPAHLKVNLLGLEDEAMDKFRPQWILWREALADKNDLYRFRVRRDAIIDWLWDESSACFLIGWPAPILDLPVPKGLMTAPETRATIVLGNAQPGVKYQLRDRDDNALPGADELDPDSAGRVTFETDILQQDTVFRIKAIKKGPKDRQREGLLINRVLVRVGIQTDNLGIRFSETEIDFDTKPTVIIENSQPEVQYQLIGADGSGLSGIVPGKAGEAILLETTDKLLDDTVIRVRATRLNDTREIDEPGLVYVRPNPGLQVQITNRILGYNAEARVVVQNAQAGVSYRLYYREIADFEIIHTAGAVSGEIGIALPDGLPAVRLDASAAVHTQGRWDNLPETAVASGGNQMLPGVTVREDTWFRVEALKRHANGHVHRSVFLERIGAVVVRPNPAIEAILLTQQPAAGSTAEVELRNAQAGVSYRLIRPDNTTAIGPEIYVHDTGESSPRRDGIGNLVTGRSSGMKVGVDFVVGASRPPQTVRLLSDPLNPVPAGLRVLARKVQTGLSVPLTATLQFTPPSGGRQTAAPKPGSKSRKPKSPRKPRKKP